MPLGCRKSFPCHGACSFSRKASVSVSCRMLSASPTERIAHAFVPLFDGVVTDSLVLQCCSIPAATLARNSSRAVAWLTLRLTTCRSLDLSCHFLKIWPGSYRDNLRFPTKLVKHR